MELTDGVEPTTAGLQNRCSTELSYASTGRPGRIRTYEITGSKPAALPLGDGSMFGPGSRI